MNEINQKLIQRRRRIDSKRRRKR